LPRSWTAGCSWRIRLCGAAAAPPDAVLEPPVPHARGRRPAPHCRFQAGLGRMDGAISAPRQAFPPARA
jgi:hypothetical protein